MPIYEDLQDTTLRAVDIIVVGGGTSGCIIAGRILEAHPYISILVIEGGVGNHDNPTISNPISYSTHLKGGSRVMSNYQSRRSPATADRELSVKTAAVLGGGSSVNFCIYTRPSAADFDRFNTNGWAFKDVPPFMQRFETFHGHGSPLIHGYDGPIHVSDGGFRVPRVEHMVIESACIGGYHEIDDPQDPTAPSSIGVSKWQRYVSPDGVRQDTAHAYLYPLLDDDHHPNLHVVLKTKVSRVLFDRHKRATGVECSNDRGDLRIIAKKLVILAAEAFGTHQILERSGIGGAPLLGSLGIPVVSELSQVGENYQDHPLISAAYKTSLSPGETVDGVLWSEHTLAQAVTTHDPILGWNGVDVCFKLRPSDADITSSSSAFQAVWAKDYREFPDKPMIYLAIVSG